MTLHSESSVKIKHVHPDSPGMQAFDSLRRCVFDCISAGKLRTTDAELISQSLWCGIHGVTALLITAKMFPWVKKDQLIRFTVDTLVAGVAA